MYPKAKKVDTSFQYTKSVSTDIRKTFERVRNEQKAKEANLDFLNRFKVIRRGIEENV